MSNLVCGQDSTGEQREIRTDSSGRVTLDPTSTITATVDETLLAKDATLTDAQAAPAASIPGKGWLFLGSDYGGTPKAYAPKVSSTGLLSVTCAALTDKTQFAQLATDGSTAVSSTNGLPVAKMARVAKTTQTTSATLQASGAYDNPTAYSIPGGVQFVTFYVKFTKGSSTSYPKVKCLLGNGTEEGAVPAIDPNTFGISSTVAEQDAYDGELYLKQLTNITNGVVPITFDVRGGATTIRLLIAEKGDTANPGTAQITLTAGY